MKRKEVESSVILDEYYKHIDNLDYFKALKYLNKMELTHKDSPWIYAKIAECFYELKNYKEAISYCELSLSKQKKYPLPLWTLGNSLYYDKKYKESIKVFKEIIQMDEMVIGRVETKQGIVWGRSLIMDCHIKLADNYYLINKDIEAKSELEKFEAIRRRRVKSSLPKSYINNIRKKMKEI
jgi:tetratricopeptide (TPR) repeat protein